MKPLKVSVCILCHLSWELDSEKKISKFVLTSDASFFLFFESSLQVLIPSIRLIALKLHPSQIDYLF